MGFKIDLLLLQSRLQVCTEVQNGLLDAGKESIWQSHSLNKSCAYMPPTSAANGWIRRVNIELGNGEFLKLFP